MVPGRVVDLMLILTDPLASTMGERVDLLTIHGKIPGARSYGVAASALSQGSELNIYDM